MAAAAGEQGTEQLMRDVIQNPVSDEVHASAKKIFDAMNAKLGPLLGFDVQHNKNFGKYVLNPSQMTEVLRTGLQHTLQLHAAMRGPLYDRATGKLMGVSMDADGPITVETFDKEVQDICKAHDAKIDAIQALVNECNAGMRQLAAQNGTTAQKLYWNINLRALLEDIPALRGKDAEIAAEFVRRLKQAAPAQGI